MTTIDRTEAQHDIRPDLTETARVLTLAGLAGLFLGVGDLYAITHLDYPWANLANSSAVWAIGAFVLGAVLRTDPARAAVAGVVMMTVAVESYYGFATAFDLNGLATMWSEHARMWLVFGVLAGVAFGVAGAWTSGRVWWQRVLGAAAGAGVLIGEALHTHRRLDFATASWHSELEQTAVVMGLLGLAVLVVTARHPKVLIPAAILTPVTTLFCAAAFSAAGIAY